jgi:hypothetical protein
MAHAVHRVISIVPVPEVRFMYMLPTTTVSIVRLPSILNVTRPMKSPVPMSMIPFVNTSTTFACRFRLVVSRVVVDVESVTVSVPLIRRYLVLMVKVCAVPADELNVTLLNSASARFAPAKVMVPPVAESKVMDPVPASQTVPSVDAFVHVPLTVHDSLPKAIAEPAAEILTFPVTVTFPLVDVRSPPDIVRFPFTVNVFVPLANVPPERVRVEAVSWDNMVLVPPEISRVANPWDAANVTFPVPENVTLEPVDVKDEAEEVSQFPVLIVMVAEPNVIVAAPEDVRLFTPKVTVALVRVSVPDHVKEFPNVVLIPEFTVTLLAVSSIEMVPPDTFTTTVEVPTV